MRIPAPKPDNRRPRPRRPGRPDALAVLARWPQQGGFKAGDVAELVNDVTTPCDPYAQRPRPTDLIEPPDRVILRDFLYPSTSRGSGGCPRDHVDEPVKRGAQTLTMKALDSGGGRALSYFVKIVRD